jgi:hypothetical protein
MRSHFRVLLTSIALCISTVTLNGCDRDTRLGLGTSAKQETIKFTSEFQAVFMVNGQVFFGKLEGAGTDWPVLREVYIIQNQVNPETKQTTNALLKRKNEMHGPDYMVLNARQIALIEPVSATSRVAQVIKQAQSQPVTPSNP